MFRDFIPSELEREMHAHLDPPFKTHGSDVMLLISNYCLNSVNRALVTVFRTIMSTLVECGEVVMHTGSQGFMEVVKLHKNCSDALKQTQCSFQHTCSICILLLLW